MSGAGRNGSFPDERWRNAGQLGSCKSITVGRVRVALARDCDGCLYVSEGWGVLSIGFLYIARKQLWYVASAVFEVVPGQPDRGESAARGRNGENKSGGRGGERGVVLIRVFGAYTIHSSDRVE